MFGLIKFQFLMVDIHIVDGECPVIKGYYQSSDQDGRHSPRIPSQKISTPPRNHGFKSVVGDAHICGKSYTAGV